MFDCFIILWIDLDTNLTQAKLNRAYCTAMQQAHPEKAPHDDVSQCKAIYICQMINHTRDILQEMFNSSSAEISDDNSDDKSESEYKWGSGGEYGDGWGPGFGEEDGFDSDERENHVTESMILEAFKILGLDPTTELTRKKLNKTYCMAIMRAHPDKAKPDEVSQQKAKELSQKINVARDMLKDGMENTDGLGTFPVDVNDSNSND